MPKRSPFARLSRGFAVASVLGTGFAIAVAAGLLAGAWIDHALGWRPIVATLGLGLCGGAVGIVFVVRTIAAFDRAERRQENDDDRKA